VNEKEYLVFPLARQNHHHDPRRVLHDLLRLVNKNEKTREIRRVKNWRKLERAPSAASSASASETTTAT